MWKCWECFKKVSISKNTNLLFLKKESYPTKNYTLTPKFKQYVDLSDKVTSDPHPHPLFTPLYYINFL